jgi:hypothetical protein
MTKKQQLTPAKLVLRKFERELKATQLKEIKAIAAMDFTARQRRDIVRELDEYRRQVEALRAELSVDRSKLNQDFRSFVVQPPALLTSDGQVSTIAGGLAANNNPKLIPRISVTRSRSPATRWPRMGSS